MFGKRILKNNVEDIVDYMIRDGCENTQSGNQIYYIDELSAGFKRPMKWFEEHYDDFLTSFYLREEILDVECERSRSGQLTLFDLNFGTKYCPNVEEYESLFTH